MEAIIALNKCLEWKQNWRCDAGLPISVIGWPAAKKSVPAAAAVVQPTSISLPRGYKHSQLLLAQDWPWVGCNGQESLSHPACVFLLSQVEPWKTFRSARRLRVLFQSNRDSSTIFFFSFFLTRPPPLLSCKRAVIIIFFFTSHWCSFSLYLLPLSPTFKPPTASPLVLSLIHFCVSCSQAGSHCTYRLCVCVCVWQQSWLILFPRCFLTSSVSSFPRLT